MHPSSYEKMAAFAREHLNESRSRELRIVDLGSRDFNGSYRAIFDHPSWTYVGADLTPGPNVDLVLSDPYHWREIAPASVDVLVSGQTFEHTDFFWESVLEIARVLRPGGLCCIIVPASGPEHRYPRDCWRIFSDGMAAVFAYGGLETLECRTQWHELPEFDAESNKWHETVAIGRKPNRPVAARWRGRVHRWLHRLVPLPAQPATMVLQAYPTHDGRHREEESVSLRRSCRAPGEWRLWLPRGAGLNPLRLDFSPEAHTVTVKSIVLRTTAGELYRADTATGFAGIAVAGDATAQSGPDGLAVTITGDDPQLILPPLPAPAPGETVELAASLAIRLKENAACP